MTVYVRVYKQTNTQIVDLHNHLPARQHLRQSSMSNTANHNARCQILLNYHAATSSIDRQHHDATLSESIYTLGGRVDAATVGAIFAAGEG